MEYQKGLSNITPRTRRGFRNIARALLVSIVLVGMLAALPMQAPVADGARIVNTFDDGTSSKIVEFTQDPLPGERATLYLKLRGDVTVTQAAINASAVLLERATQATGTGLVGLGLGIDNSGDYNDDGFTDLFVTAPGSTSTQTSEGFLAAVRGSVNGLAFPPAFQMWGGVANAYFGWSISMGDLNEDGYDDIIVSRIEMDFTTSTGTGTGDVLIYWGGRSVNTTADVTLSYGANGDMFGYSVSTHGDVNGDGHLDLVVGSPRNEVNTNNPGRAFVYYGTGNSTFPSSPNVTLTGTDNGDGFGRVVHICGDVNDDGYDDILVGAPGHNGTSDFDVGKAYVFYGGSSGVDTTADWTYTGSNEEDYLGYSGTGLLDANNDGIDDMAIGVPLWDDGTSTDVGQALVFYGSGSGPAATPDVTIKGDTSSGFLGIDLASAEDINDDGLGDLVIGVPNTDNGSLTSAGHIQIHFGNDNGLSSSPEKILRGWVDDGDSGFSVGPGGDVDGDGYDDISTGDPTGQVTYTYFGGPSAPAPAIYVDDVEIWSHTGSYVGTDRTDDFADVLNAYIQSHQGDVDVNGELKVPINISMSAKGRLKLDDVMVQFYKLVQPTGLKATPVAIGGAIKLNWDDHTIKADDISKMSVEMWNGTGWEEIEKVPKQWKEFIVTGLTDGVQYQFRLRAFDGAVQIYSDPSEVAMAIPGDTKAPDRVLNVKATEDRDAMGINLSWDPSDEDTVNYEVWSNKTGTWAVLANITSDTTHFIDTEIDDGPYYWYRVRAWDEVPLFGEFSAIVRGRLLDKEGPAVPTNLRVEPLPVGRSLRLSWDLNDDDTVGYSIESNKTGVWKEITLVGRLVSTYTDTGLSDGTTYWYRLSAYDESDNPSNYTQKVSGVPQDLTAPSTPKGLVAVPRPAGNIIRLTWAQNTDDTVSYRVYMSQGSSGFDVVAEVLAIYTQYDVQSLVDGTSYRFRIAAVDAAGQESTPSDEVTAVPVDTLPPLIPQNLKYRLDPEGGATNITWDLNEDDTVSYRVYQWNGASWDLRGEVADPVAWFNVGGLTNDQPYAFIVRAVDEADNESPNSARVDVIPKDTTAPDAPVFIDLPSFTNVKDWLLTGVCQPGARVTVFVNLVPEDPVTCDEEGLFAVQVRFKSGPNEVTADAVDDSGISTSSQRYTVRVDTTAPRVETTEPSAGTRDVTRTNLTYEIRFSEDVKGSQLRSILRKGKHDLGTMLLFTADPSGNVEARLKEYDQSRWVATFEVDPVLEADTTYTILVYSIEDVAGNPMDPLMNGHAWQVTTVASSGGGGGGGGGDDAGLGNLAWIIAAVIIIVLVVVVAFVLVSRSGTHEEIEVERAVIEAPSFDETVEMERPDIQALYAESYQERGEEDGEHHQVDAGLGAWLAEQEEASKKADEETRRLVEEMASKGGPTAEDLGPVEEVPPGLVEETTPAYHMEEPGAEAEEAEEAEEAPHEPEGDEASEPGEEEDDAASLLDELESELESELEEEKED